MLAVILYQTNNHTAMRKTILFAALLNGLSSAAATETPDTIATQQLNEVVVEGEKPQVRAKDGIMVVDLQIGRAHV